MPRNDLILRAARVGDSEELTRLAAVLGYPVDHADMRARLTAVLCDARHHVLVAGNGGDRLLGWVHIEQRVSLGWGDRAEIMGLIVDPDVRRRGIGESLVKTAEQWAASRSVPTISVRSNVMRDESHAFYEVLGYARLKTQHVYEKALL